MQRYGWIELTLGSRGSRRGGPWWLDAPLWDIPATVLGAVKAATDRGAVQVTVHEAVMTLQDYEPVRQLLAERGVRVFTVKDGDYERKEWRP